MSWLVHSRLPIQPFQSTHKTATASKPRRSHSSTLPLLLRHQTVVVVPSNLCRCAVQPFFRCPSQSLKFKPRVKGLKIGLGVVAGHTVAVGGWRSTSGALPSPLPKPQLAVARRSPPLPLALASPPHGARRSSRRSRRRRSRSRSPPHATAVAAACLCLFKRRKQRCDQPPAAFCIALRHFSSLPSPSFPVPSPVPAVLSSVVGINPQSRATTSNRLAAS